MPKEVELDVGSVEEILKDQDPASRKLFAKALNLFVSPGAQEREFDEKVADLKRVIEGTVPNM